MTFADKVKLATQSAYAQPFLPSKAEIYDSLQPLVDELLTMKQKDAWAYICASFRNIGHESWVVRTYKEAIDTTQLMSR